MWLTRAKLPGLASSIVKILVDQELIETESPPGVQADLLAVLEQYVRDESAISTNIGLRSCTSVRQLVERVPWT